jgi:hypothetical protein
MGINKKTLDDGCIALYDSRGHYTGRKLKKEVEPYSRFMKDFFNFGGTVVINGHTVGCHNTLAGELRLEGYAN